MYQINMLIAPPAADLAGLPSILGRDVLNRWHMAYRPTQDKLTFDIVTSDGQIPIK
jgi:hypothetical protein